MRFAYLILAHDNFGILGHLVKMLDDPRNDIYVHIDKKVRTVPQLEVHRSKLYFVQDRVDVRWGTVSQIKAIFALIGNAIGHGPYHFYHVISGTHLPLKSQDFIHRHFEQYVGSSVLRLWKPDDGDADFKMRRLHFWIDNFQSQNRALKYLVQHLWTANMAIQRALGIRQNRNCSFVKADEWVSLSQGAALYLLSAQKSILAKYRFTFCCDEYAIATELSACGSSACGSPSGGSFACGTPVGGSFAGVSPSGDVTFGDVTAGGVTAGGVTAGGALKSGPFQIVNDQYLLYVDFEQDHPRSLTKVDYQSLLQTPYIFARKFTDPLA